SARLGLGGLDELLETLDTRLLGGDDGVRLLGDARNGRHLVERIARYQFVARYGDHAIVSQYAECVAIRAGTHHLGEPCSADGTGDVFGRDGNRQGLLGDSADLARDTIGTSSSSPGHDQADVSLGEVCRDS